MALHLNTLRRALSIICEDPASRMPGDLRPSVDHVFSNALRWRREPGVQALGIARKVSGGHVTDDLAIKIYVEKKLSLRSLNYPVPEFVEVPGIRSRIKTDVEEIGRIRFENNRSRVRPASPGFSIGRAEGKAGTLGCLVRRLDQPEKLFILSNAHVMLRDGVGSVGDDIYQPAGIDEPALPANKIAELSDWRSMEFSRDGYPNLIDAAIAEVIEPSDVTPYIHNIGLPMGIKLRLRRNMRVHKTGSTTDHRTGKILDTDFWPELEYQRPGGGVGRVGFRDQVLCDRFSDDGDSGSAVLDMNNRVVGLHFAGTGNHSIFNKIEHVLNLLQIDIECDSV